MGRNSDPICSVVEDFLHRGYKPDNSIHTLVEDQDIDSKRTTKVLPEQHMDFVAKCKQFLEVCYIKFGFDLEECKWHPEAGQDAPGVQVDLDVVVGQVVPVGHVGLDVDSHQVALVEEVGPMVGMRQVSPAEQVESAE